MRPVAAMFLQFTVLTASSLEQLSSESATKVLWCGWKNILSEPNVCELRFSMLRDSFFAVKPGQQGLLSIGACLLHAYACSSHGHAKHSSSMHGSHVVSCLSLDVVAAGLAHHAGCYSQSLQCCHQLGFEWVGPPTNIDRVPLLRCILLLNPAGQPELSCSVTVPDHGDRDIRVGCFWTLAAVVLFAFAGHLAQSQAFRLTTGGLMGVTGAAAIVLFVLMR